VLSSVATSPSLSPCLSQSSVSRQDSKVAEEEDGDRLINRLAVPQLPTRDQVPVFASLFEQQQSEASVFFFAVFFSVESGCQCVIEISSIGEHPRCCRSLLLAYIPQLRWPTTGITRELSEISTRTESAGGLPRNCER